MIELMTPQDWIILYIYISIASFIGGLAVPILWRRAHDDKALVFVTGFTYVVCVGTLGVGLVRLLTSG